MPYTAKAVTPDVKAKALQNAQMKAVEMYYAEAGESESAAFDAMRQKIVENPGSLHPRDHGALGRRQHRFEGRTPSRSRSR